MTPARPPDPHEQILKALSDRLVQLDFDHSRARSPRARRRIEARMAEIRREEANLKEMAAAVDITWAKLTKLLDTDVE